MDPDQARKQKKEQQAAAKAAKAAKAASKKDQQEKWKTQGAAAKEIRLKEEFVNKTPVGEKKGFQFV
jgi:F0F1-type ATP synthase assembly protein I